MSQWELRRLIERCESSASFFFLTIKPGNCDDIDICNDNRPGLVVGVRPASVDTWEECHAWIDGFGTRDLHEKIGQGENKK